MNENIQHLRLIVIGHYITAAFVALVACFPLIHLTIGLIFLFNPPPPENGEPFPAAVFGLLFALIGGAFVLGGWALATCLLVAGRSLAARKRYNFCFVIAAISCVFMPIGTVQGVFSLIVLSRPAVKAMFLPQETVGTAMNIPQPGMWRDESFVERNAR